MRKRWMWIVPAALAGMALFGFLGGQIVLHLWNWVVPALFGLRPITFWQALALLALCRILFGGFSLHGPSGHMRRRMAARWEHMTPEERERLRQGMKERWGCGPAREGQGQ